MTTATKKPPRRTTHHPRVRALHMAFGALEMAGTRLAEFAKNADKKLVTPAKKQAQKTTT